MTGRPLEPTPPASGSSSLLRPLLPAQSQSRGPELPQRHFEFKRKRQAAACEPCREHKTKCDGNRPSCNACLRRSTECRFEAEPKETHVQALKRKFDSLQGEASSLQQVYDLLRTRPEAEALSIFHKIRDGESHESILQFVRHGDLMLQLSLTTEASPRTSKFSSGDTVASSTLSEPLSPPFDGAPRGSISSATSTQGYTSTQPTQSASASRRPSTAPHVEQRMDCELVISIRDHPVAPMFHETILLDMVSRDQAHCCVAASPCRLACLHAFHNTTENTPRDEMLGTILREQGYPGFGALHRHRLSDEPSSWPPPTSSP